MLKTARSYLHSSGQSTGMWRKDRRIDGHTCEQCGRAVKRHYLMLVPRTRKSLERASCVAETPNHLPRTLNQAIFDRRPESHFQQSLQFWFRRRDRPKIYRHDNTVTEDWLVGYQSAPRHVRHGVGRQWSHTCSLYRYSLNISSHS